MPDSKITDLTSLTIPSNNDVLPIVDVLNDTTKKIAVSSLGNFFNTTVNSNSANYILDGGNAKGTSLIIGTNDNFNLNFETNGVTRITLSSSGELGIGTTTPIGRLHINDTTLAGSGGLSDPALNITQTWNTSGTPAVLRVNVVDLSSNINSSLIDLLSGGVSRFRVSKAGNITVPTNSRITDNNNLFSIRDTTRSSAMSLTAAQGMKFIYGNSLEFLAEFISNGWLNIPNKLVINNNNASDTYILGPRWTLGGNGVAGELIITDQSSNPGHLCLGPNTKLMYDANNAFGVRNGANAQTFSIYRTFTSPTVYERLTFKSSAGNNCIIGAETSPFSGTWRNLEFQTLTATRYTITNTGVHLFSQGGNTNVQPQPTGTVNLKAAFESQTPFRIEDSSSISTLASFSYFNTSRWTNQNSSRMNIFPGNGSARIQFATYDASYILDEVGVGIAIPTRQLHVRANSSFPNSPTSATALSSPFPVFRIDNAVAGTPVDGIGTRIEFGTRVTNSASFIGNTIDSVATNIANGTESFDFSFRNSNAGTAHAERLRIKSTGAIKFTSVGANPSSPETGDVYFNSTVNRLRFYDASNARWNNINSTRTIETFIATENQPVSANFATLDTRNIDNIAVLNFPPLAPNREARFVGTIPEGTIMNDGLLVKIRFSTRTATTSSCRWGAQIKKVSSLSYATSASVDVPITGTAGLSLMNGDITLTSTDSLTEGDIYALRILRESSNAADTMADTAQLVSVEVRAIN